MTVASLAKLQKLFRLGAERYNGRVSARLPSLVVAISTLADLQAIGRPVTSSLVEPRVASAASIGIDVQARAIHAGELVVLTINLPRAVDHLDVRAFGRPVATFKVDDRTWRALVGIDLAVKAGRHQVSIDGGGDGLYALHQLQVRPHRFASRAVRVDQAFVNPPADARSRIEREAKELAAIWKASTSERLWQGPFLRPVPGAATSRFGTRSIFNGKRRAPHSGADFLSPEGAVILAPNSGRVVLARALYFTGNTVVVDHGLGVFSLLAHLSTIDVEEGASAKAGQVVGTVGATGRASGPHLHWAVRVNDARVDPLAVLALLH